MWPPGGVCREHIVTSVIFVQKHNLNLILMEVKLRNIVQTSILQKCQDHGNEGEIYPR